MRKLENNKTKIDMNNIPKHIAFIMDGNGRWAQKRFLPRTAGHRAGVDALLRVMKACRDYGIKTVSLYAFSTENYNRSDSECEYIFGLIKKFAVEKCQQMIENNTKLNICGDLDYSNKLDEETKIALRDTAEATKNCTEYTLNLCFSYGGRHEITEAVNKLIAAGKKTITEDDISSSIYTAGQNDPDLIVRASGEHRLSNFLMWQSAYAELYFPPVFWPDFDKRMVEECIIEYQKRERKFGNVK